MATPSDSEWKSWSLTGCASFSQQVPAFLNIPTCSFFFVSTLITGQPSKKNVSRKAAIYSNCSFLSGDVACAIDFRLVFKENPISFKRRETVLELTSMPRWYSSCAILSVVRRLHFNPVIGSPAVSCSSNCSMAERISGVFFNARSPCARGPYALRLKISLQKLSATFCHRMGVKRQQLGNPGIPTMAKL